MKNLLLCLFIFLFFGCMSKKREDNGYSEFNDHKSDLYLTSLVEKDSIARQTILDVIDTVEYYKCRLSAWPDSAVYTILKRYWVDGSEEPLQYNINNVLSIYNRDTLCANYYFSLVDNKEMNLKDMIICADFKLIVYQYLTKKYRRLLLREAELKGVQNDINAFYPLWDNLFLNFDEIINEIIFEDKKHPLRDYECSLYYAQLYKRSLLQITDLVSVISVSGNDISRQIEDLDFDMLFNLATEITCSLSNESHRILISDNINTWYLFYKDLQEMRYKVPLNQRRKYDIFLDNVLAFEYKFLIDIKTIIEGRNEFIQKMQDK